MPPCVRWWLREEVPIVDPDDRCGSFLQLYFRVAVDCPQKRRDCFTAFDVAVVELVGHAHRGQPFAQLGLGRSAHRFIL